MRLEGGGQVGPSDHLYRTQVPPRPIRSPSLAGRPGRQARMPAPTGRLSAGEVSNPRPWPRTTIATPAASGRSPACVRTGGLPTCRELDLAGLQPYDRGDEPVGHSRGHIHKAEGVQPGPDCLPPGAVIVRCARRAPSGDANNRRGWSCRPWVGVVLYLTRLGCDRRLPLGLDRRLAAARGGQMHRAPDSVAVAPKHQQRQDRGHHDRGNHSPDHDPDQIRQIGHWHQFIAGFARAQGEVVCDAAWPAIIDRATQESDPG
jgi:hypothetical protein